MGTPPFSRSLHTVDSVKNPLSFSKNHVHPKSAQACCYLVDKGGGSHVIINHMDEQQKLVGPVGVIFDLILTIVFFFFMVKICMAHAPAESLKWQLIAGGFCALPITGVFWLAINLFRVTLVDQLRRKKK